MEICWRVARELLESCQGIVFAEFGVGELSEKSWRAVGELLAPRGGGRRESCERVAAGGGRIVEELLENCGTIVGELHGLHSHFVEPVLSHLKKSL